MANAVAISDAVAIPCASLRISSGSAFLNKSNAQKLSALYGAMEMHVARKPLKNPSGPSLAKMVRATSPMLFALVSTLNRRRMISRGYVTMVAVHAAPAPASKRAGTANSPVSLFVNFFLYASYEYSIALEYGKIRTTCGTFPRQYPATPSVFPIATNAANNPLSAAATLAALALDAPDVCMMIFSRSSGAVHVFASAPATPPARNIATAGFTRCVAHAIGLSRSAASL